MRGGCWVVSGGAQGREPPPWQQVHGRLSRALEAQHGHWAGERTYTCLPPALRAAPDPRRLLPIPCLLQAILRYPEDAKEISYNNGQPVHRPYR